MAEVVIAVRPSPSLSLSEMRAWLTDRAPAGRPALVLSGAEGSSGDGLRVLVEIDDGATETGMEELVDLMTDMRLLGLRPVVVPAGG